MSSSDATSQRRLNSWHCSSLHTAFACYVLGSAHADDDYNFSSAYYHGFASCDLDCDGSLHRDECKGFLQASLKQGQKACEKLSAP